MTPTPIRKAWRPRAMAGLMLVALPSLALAGLPPRLPQVTTQGQAMPADGWVRLDAHHDAALIPTLRVCAGTVWTLTPGAPTCHAPSTRYTAPTFWRFGQAIPGAPQPFMSPQAYLDASTSTGQPRRVYTGVAQDNSGAVWLFYRIGG